MSVSVSQRSVRAEKRFQGGLDAVLEVNRQLLLSGSRPDMEYFEFEDVESQIRIYTLWKLCGLRLCEVYTSA